MARGPLTFKQADVTRAVKAIERAGKTVARVRIARDGAVTIVCVAEPLPPPANPWDRVFKDD